MAPALPPRKGRAERRGRNSGTGETQADRVGERLDLPHDRKRQRRIGEIPTRVTQQETERGLSLNDTASPNPPKRRTEMKRRALDIPFPLAALIGHHAKKPLNRGCVSPRAGALRDWGAEDTREPSLKASQREPRTGTARKPSASLTTTEHKAFKASRSDGA